MNSPAPGKSYPPERPGPDRRARRQPRSAALDGPYGMPFWRAYLANILVMMAIALLYRYADFVTILGGRELHLGWIVGVGTVGSLMVRLFLGPAIDQYGPRRVWLSSLVVFSAVCFSHLAITTYAGPGIYLLRIAFSSAIAGIMGSAMTFVSGRAPVARMAEMIGMLGTSGFLGIVLGTQLGDLLLGTETIQRWQVDRMFLIAGALGLCALLFVWGATRHQPRPARRRRPPLVWVVRRYFPGTVLLVGVAMGVALALPTTFLRTYAAELDIPRIGLFFAVYAPTAILTRLFTRRLPERLGLAPMILVGLGLLMGGQLLLIGVTSEWTFIVPGIVYGMGHAILVPTSLAAGSTAFPSRYRGLSLTFMMATFDVGNLVGAPMAGAIVHFSGAAGLPSYPTLFVSVAAMLGLVAVVFALTRREGLGGRGKSDRTSGKRAPTEAADRGLVQVGADR